MQLTIILKTLSYLSLGALGQPSYDPASPNRIYFSIGSAITAIALLLTITQLIRPITRFRLSTGVFKLTAFYVVFVIGILFVFVAAILPFIPGKALPLVGYPVFWEICAGLLIVFASLGFLWSINKYVQFNKKNYRKYLEYCTSFIARGNENDLRELADEISNSIEEIVRACKKYNSLDAHFAKKDGKEYKITEYIQYALALLDVWSDKDFCRVIVCHVPHTAIEIFKQIEKQQLYDSGGYSLVNQLIQQAFAERNSILYREEEYYGLGHFKMFTSIVFSNYDLIESNFRPLQAWRYWEDDNLQTWKVEKYLKVLNMSVEANITSGWSRGHPSALWCGFNELGDIAMSQSIKLERLTRDEVYYSPAFKNLSIVGRGLKDAVKILCKYEKDIPDDVVHEEDYDEFKDWSVYGVVAYGIYKLYVELSTVHKHDESIRMLAIDLWLDVYPVSRGQESKAIIEIQKRLNIHLFKNVKENLENLWYPMVTRLLLNLMELGMPKAGEEECGRTRFKDKFFKLLREHYESASKQDAKKASDMLPENVRYDNIQGQLIKTHPFGGTSVLNLRDNM